jgi:ribonucleoside-diphosphate reductase beta chain
MPLDFESFPLRAFRKSRELDWDPLDIDFSRDRDDWAQLTSDEQDMMLRQVDGFYIGERAVTHDLGALQQCLRQQRGRMGEEMYLTAQLYEESRHIEFFQMWLDETLPGEFGTDIPYPNMLQSGMTLDDLLNTQMTKRFHSLFEDPSPENQVRAVVVYHMIVEGVAAEVGYHLFYDMIDAKSVLPGLREGITLIKRDESRHVAFGIYLLQRLLAEDPSLIEVFEEEMHLLKPRACQGIDQAFVHLAEPYPFGLDHGRYLELVDHYFDARLEAVKRGALVEI